MQKTPKIWIVVVLLQKTMHILSKIYTGIRIGDEQKLTLFKNRNETTRVTSI